MSAGAGAAGGGGGASGAAPSAAAPPNRRLAVLLAAAMFVLVVDTSFMNVSISAVVHDLGTTVSGVQTAIALEALVSASFILLGSRVADLVGRRRAYVLGLVGYGVGAVAMTLAQSLVAVVVCWSVVGGLGAALLLPSMQSLVHGNFEGGARKAAYALVGAAASVAAAVGPVLGGLVTTTTSWRVAFGLEAVVIVVVLAGVRLVRDVPYTGPRQVDVVGTLLSVLGMGGVVLGVLVWQEGGQGVVALVATGLAALVGLGAWLLRQERRGRAALLDADLFRSAPFRVGVAQQLLQQVALGGAMIALPVYLQMALGYDALLAGLSLAPLSLSMFAAALVAGRRPGARRPAVRVLAGFGLLVVGVLALLPLVPRATSGWWLAVPLVVAGTGLGLLVSQLNAYTLSPVPEQRASEAAGVVSAGGSFGLALGLAVAGAVMLASLAAGFSERSQASDVLPPDDKAQVAAVLEEDAEVMSDAQLDALLADETPEVRAEILRINDVTRERALQVALLVPLVAGALGVVGALRMRRLPDPDPSAPTTEVLG